MTQLSPEARRLVQLARAQDEPSPAALNRIERVLAARIARGIGATAAGALWAQSASGVVLGTSKVVGIAMLTGAVSAVGYWALPSLAPTPTAASAASPKVREVTSSPASNAWREQNAVSSAATVIDNSTAPMVASCPHVAPRPVAALSNATPSAPEVPDTLREETAELRRAQQALRSGNSELALKLLSQQDQTFRNGVLQQERSAARALALCQSGHKDLARTEAEHFEQRWPKSALVARVRSSCL